MAYSGRTSFYNIPIALNGDILDESENLQQMQMIDDFLEAATGIIGTGVIQEGLFSIVADTGSGHKVLLDPVAGMSIQGLLNSGLVSSASQIAWTNLQTGNFYFLYLQFTTELYEDATKFTIVSKTDPIDSSNFNYLFMATIDLTGSPVLDSDPEGKVYSSEFRTHTGTQFNPHTSFLTQTNLSVTGSISGNLNTNETLRINQEFPTSIQPLMTFNHVTSGTPVMRSMNELVLGDLRTTTQLSASGQVGFDNLRPSVLGAINENWGVLDSLLSSITGNTDAIAVNTGNIALNSSNIVQNTGDLSQNSSDIQINTIQSNTQAATNISQAVSIFNNSVNITGNTVNIIPNTALVLGNTNDIATNTSNIVSLTGQVSVNAAAIGLNASQIFNLGGRVGVLECDVFNICPSSSSSSSSILIPCEANSANTVLHTHMDGLNGSITFIDKSLSVHTITAFDNAQISTAQSKFGGASGLFDGTLAHLKIIDNLTDFQFGTSIDFTIDFWARIDNLGVVNSLFGSQNDIGSVYIDAYWTSTQGLVFRSSIDTFIQPYSATINVWTHYAFVRSGSIIYIFANGVLLGTQAVTGSFGVVNGFYIGRIREDLGFRMSGHIDEFRVVKGSAIWTSTFTPSAFPYCNL